MGNGRLGSRSTVEQINDILMKFTTKRVKFNRKGFGKGGCATQYDGPILVSIVSANRLSVDSFGKEVSRVPHDQVEKYGNDKVASTPHHDLRQSSGG